MDDRATNGVSKLTPLFRHIRVASVFVLVTLTASSTQSTQPTSVILLIADGAGVPYWTALALASDDPAFKQLPVVGLVETQCADSLITDSGASATAFASGVRTYYHAVGMDADTNAVPTVLEIAQQRGWATGLVVTSTITHATPASFAAHVVDRNMDFEIARQLSESGIDVLLGGGRRYFDVATRADSSDGSDILAAMASEYQVALTPEEFFEVNTDSISKLIGLFASRHMTDAFSRTPTLPEMAATAIEMLERDPDGFFLMIEGSQPDFRGEDNTTLDSITAEMVDFDRAIRLALDYQQDHPSTLVVVAVDHDAGGLALQHARPGDPDYVEIPPGQAEDAPLVARYTSGGHTGTMVPIFASGPGAERFGGVKENWEIGVLLLEAVRP